MTTSPLVFTSDKQVITTAKWLEDLKNNSSNYGDCFVRRITHVKNLKSTFLHEYLQIIFEDTGHGKNPSDRDRTRIIAERQNSQDQVIIGLWSFGERPKVSGKEADSRTFFERFKGFFGSSSSSSSGDELLPLPLFSLTFDEDNLNAIDLAAILSETTSKLLDYNVATRNCFHFAEAVYDVARLKYHGKSEPWRFSDLKKSIVVWKTDEINASAQGLEEGNKSKFQYVPADDFEITLNSFYTAAVQFVRDEGIHLNEEDEKQLIGLCSSKDSAERTTEKTLKSVDVKDIEEIMQDSVDKILVDPRKDELLTTYQRYADQATETSRSSTSLPSFSCIKVSKISEELEQKSEEALKVLAGAVLQGLEKQNASG